MYEYKINEHDGQETSEPSSYIAAYIRIIVDKNIFLYKNGQLYCGDDQEIPRQIVVYWRHL